MNLSGQYHPSDTVMSIISLDTKTVIDFTVDNLKKNPKTKEAYVYGSPYVDNLCTKYPYQTDLIKSILYPVDINTAINAKDLTLLGYGSGYLESYEEDAIIASLKLHLAYMNKRWLFGNLSFEAYYFMAFYGILIQSLVHVIHAARFENLWTENVHSFHIWEYLMSKGLDDYRDILTREQSLFLYKNLDYIYANRGKQSTLRLLVDNILDTSGVGLIGKYVDQRTDTGTGSCLWIPEITSKAIDTKYKNEVLVPSAITLLDFNQEIVNAGLEVQSSSEYVASLTTKIGSTHMNTFPTKMLEIQKLNLDQRYGALLDRFILENLIYMASTSQYTTDVSVVDPYTSDLIDLSVKDALVLYSYAIHKHANITPTLLPSTATALTVYKPSLKVSDLPTTYTYDGCTYLISNYINVNDLINEITYPVDTILENTDFSDFLGSLFDIMIRHVKYSRDCHDFITFKILNMLYYNYLLQNKVYTINFATEVNYTDWFVNRNLGKIISMLDSSQDSSAHYLALSQAIMTQLIPITNKTLIQYQSDTSGIDGVYDRLRKLFISLCSYNVAFLDTSRSTQVWSLSEKIIIDVPKSIGTGELFEFRTCPTRTIDSSGTEEFDTLTDSISTKFVPSGISNSDIDIFVSDITKITEHSAAYIDVVYYPKNEKIDISSTKQIYIPTTCRTAFSEGR
jgi:hypothetical protein